MLCTNIIVACLGATVLAKGYYQRPNHGQAGRGFIVCQRAGIGEVCSFPFSQQDED